MILKSAHAIIPLFCGIIFLSPSMLPPYLDNFFCFCGNGMIESMLEPHLKDSAGANQTHELEGKSTG